MWESSPLTSFGLQAAPFVYTGPGDIAGITWSTFTGLRAFSAATRGSKAININNGSTTGDVFTDSVTGNLVTTGGLFTGGPYNVLKMYDQTGNGNDFDNAANGGPPLLLSTLGILPVMSFVAGSNTRLAELTGSFTLAQPYCMSIVAKRISDATSNHDGIYADRSNGIWVRLDTSGNFTFSTDNGTTTVTLASTANVWHAILATANGTNSEIYLDAGANSIVNPAGSGFLSGDSLVLGTDTSLSNPFNGQIVEAGFCTGTGGIVLTGSLKNQLQNNQKNYWGI